MLDIFFDGVDVRFFFLQFETCSIFFSDLRPPPHEKSNGPSLTNHRLLTEHQSGNRKKHSTETLNIAVTDMLLEAMDNKQLSIVILLDMSKAFDSVDHNMLLQRILN